MPNLTPSNDNEFGMRYGDNIFEIGAVVSLTLRYAGWPREKINDILAQIRAAKSYDDAISICRQYITIKDKCH